MLPNSALSLPKFKLILTCGMWLSTPPSELSEKNGESFGDTGEMLITEMN
jgi:hypothetical protein